MRTERQEFFNIMNSFRKLNISSMLPEISHGEFGILKMIGCCSGQGESGESGVKISYIVRQMCVPPSAVSRSLRSLESKAMVERKVDPADRRNTFVMLTEKGRETLNEVETIMEDFSDAVVGNLGDETMWKLNGYLRALLETSKEEIEKRKYTAKKGERE